jgi:putative ABC transport system substrate-binding protein
VTQKNPYIFTILTAMVVLFLSTFSFAAEKKVFITAIVEHPALDAVRDGVVEQLKEEGFTEGDNLIIDYKSAQGNPATAKQIADKFVSEKPDVIVGIATPSAQALVAATRKIPIVFSAVTDPVGAKLIKKFRRPGKNVTGVSDLSPIRKHMEFIKELSPQAETVGVVYNAGEANAVTLVELLKQHAPEVGLQIRTATVAKSSDVDQAAASLAGKVDVFYVPTDNTVVSALESLVNRADSAGKPVYAADTDSVKRGAVAAIGFNYFDLGKQTGKLVAMILNGKKPGKIDAEGVSKTELFLNVTKAEKLGMTIPDSILKSAKEIIR